MHVPTTRNAASISSPVTHRWAAARRRSPAPRSTRRRARRAARQDGPSPEGPAAGRRRRPGAARSRRPPARRPRPTGTRRRGVRHGAPAPAARSPPLRRRLEPVPVPALNPCPRFETTPGPKPSQPAKRCATSQCRANVERAISSAFSSAWATIASRTSGGRPCPTTSMRNAPSSSGLPPSTSANLARGSMSSPNSSVCSVASDVQPIECSSET